MVGKNTLELIIAARDRTGGAFRSVKTRMKGLEGVSGKVTNALKGAAKAGVLIGGAAVIAGIAGSTKAFMDFEDAMANVRKTTGFTKDQIGVLGNAINDMALRIPVAQTELAGIAAVAGQLGITGQKNILGFTETAAKMSTAFDMSAESVAIAAAKLSNIYDIPIEKVSNLGSAINALGNTTAASESQILDFSMSLGASAKMLGFGETEAVAMGASLVSMGMDASAAGTRLNSAFTQMGKNVDKVSELLGITEEEFKAGFGEDPMNMLIRIITKLGEIEDPLDRNTMAAETFGLIGAKAIVNLGANVDGLKTNLKTSAAGFEENTSLTEEFAAKTDTLKARFSLLKNSITSLLIDIGGELAPTLNQVIEGFRNILPAVKEVLFEMGAGFKEHFESIARQAGPALNPLIAKVKEAGEKMSKGLNFKTLADDLGVFVGIALGGLMKAITWLIDKLGPLWELIGKGAGMFHDLANALKTEEGRLDDILDATQEVTKAKQDLFDINERLRGNVETLAGALEKAGGWTSTLVDLEADAKTKTDALAVARLKAGEAITVHGANSEIAKTAIENVKIAEEAATAATNDFNTAVGTAAGAIIDGGVATEGLQKAQLDFAASTEEVTTKQGDLKTSVELAEKEMKEAKAAPFDLGAAFTNFGKIVASIFLELPLKIAESILKVVDVVNDGLGKIGLGAFAEKFDSAKVIIEEKIEDIRESLETGIEKPLSEDIPKASEAMEKAITGAAKAIVTPARRAKEGVDEVREALEDTVESAEDTGEAGEDAFKKVKITVDKATGEIEVLTKNLGQTASGFEENERAAKTLLALDWDVFSKLEAELPRINSGIGDMESAFTGLETVLDQNMTKLENVKTSVENISELTIPFLDKGFLDGIKVIGLFANALKDASSAINSFSDIQDVSIAGCTSFSLKVNDMVSALRILEAQMEDLVPAFGDMDSLITNIADAFLYSDGKMEAFTGTFSDVMASVNSDLDSTGIAFDDFKNISDKALDAGFITYGSKLETGAHIWKTTAVNSIEDVEFAITQAQRSLGEVILAEDTYTKDVGIFHWFDEYEGEITEWGDLSRDTYGDVTKAMRDFMKTNYGVSISVEDMYNVMQKTPEGQEKWFQDIARSDTALTFQMDKQTNALKSQNEQLSKITDALQPYLNFMRTLNELAALSTLSTNELNSGLNSINDTLVNLGSALSDFDLEPVMKSLFGTGIENDAEGAADKFMTTMLKHESDFVSLIGYIDRLSISMATLTNAFTVFSALEKSVLSDPTALKAVFESITEVMTNFSVEMGESGFADKIAKGLDKMLTSAEPLVLYFRNNNKSITEFNDTLSTFRNTLTNVVDVMGQLKEISEMVLPLSGELELGFDKANEALKAFDEALSEHMGVRWLGEGAFEVINEEAFSDNLITNINTFGEHWAKIEAAVGDSIDTFISAATTITDLAGAIEKLDVLTELTVSSADKMVDGFERAKDMIKEFDEALSEHMGVRWLGEGAFEVINEEAFSDNLITNINTFGEHWAKIEAAVGDSIDTFVTATTTISNLLRAMMLLSKTISDFDETTALNVDKLKEDLGKVALAARELETYLGKDAWKGVTTDIGAFSKKWKEVNGNIEETVKSFSAFASVISSIVSSSSSLISAITDIGDVSIITSDKMEEAFGAIPKMMTEMTEYMAGDSFKAVKDDLSGLNTEYLLHKEILDKIMPSFESATGMFSTLAQQVISVSDAFITLKDSTVISSRDMEKAIDNIKTFTVRFTEALHSNLGALVTILTDLDTEWKIHSKVMEEVMPSFKSATSDVGSLIGTVTSLSSALKAMSKMGTITSDEFGKGFGSMIASISNFSTALQKNVGPLIGSLQELRRIWVENEEVLVPLMQDFQIITRNLKSVADNANAMSDSFRNINKGWVLLERGFDRLVDFIKTTVVAIKEFYTPEAAAEVSTFIKDIGLVIDSFEELNSKIEGALNDIKSKISGAVENIETRLLSLGKLNESMFYSGQNLIKSFINGINSMQEALEEALENIANTIKAYLGVASPTELGALKNVDEWPRNLVKSFSEGINAEMGALNTSFSGMVAPAIVSEGRGGGSRQTTITFHITQKITDKNTADYAVKALERAIQKHAPI